MSALPYRKVDLSDQHHVLVGRLPDQFNFSQARFDEIWNLHPEEYHVVNMMGKDIPTPRWQQAYGMDYRYTGAKQNALPIPPLLAPYHDWSCDNLKEPFNGFLLNWYTGDRKHYIGAHRDDTRDLVPDSSIVTISLGEERVFRMRPWRSRGFEDIILGHGEFVMIPWATNKAWTHEVPHFQRYQERRISITLRVFKETE